MSQEQIPGLAFAVIRGRETIRAAGAGVASAEDDGPPVTPRTLFRIGSITKVLTGLAILRLTEAGLLELDAPVTRYLPWLTLSEPGLAGEITLQMLLTHTSGLPSDTAERGSREPEGLERYLRTELQRYSLVASPGRLFCYSNLGFSLLGHVAEEVTGLTYPELMQRLVFSPLGMERTTLDPTLAMSYPLAQSHRRRPDGSLQVIRPFADNTALAPAGFAFSTVLDLANLARMFLSGGCLAGEPFLSSALAAAMINPLAPIYSPGKGGRGLALRVDPHPGSGIPRVGHMGGISGFRALFELYPSANAAVIVLANRVAPIGKVRDLLLEECLNQPTSGWQPSTVTPAPDRHEWPGYTGAYLSQTDGLARISIEAGQLLLDWNGERLPLSCLGPGHHVAQRKQGGLIGAGFLPEPDGEVRYLLLNETPFQRIRMATDEIHRGWYEQYEGVYQLSQAPMTVRLRDEALYLHSGFYSEEAPCIAISDTEFACKWGRFTFEFAPDDDEPGAPCRAAGQTSRSHRVIGMRWAQGHFVPRIAAHSDSPQTCRGHSQATQPR